MKYYWQIKCRTSKKSGFKNNSKYKYNYHKSKLMIGVKLPNLLKCLKCMTHFDTMSWIIEEEDMNNFDGDDLHYDLEADMEEVKTEDPPHIHHQHRRGHYQHHDPRLYY